MAGIRAGIPAPTAALAPRPEARPAHEFLDAPAVLGWEAWRAARFPPPRPGASGGTSPAMDAGEIDPPPLHPARAAPAGGGGKGGDYLCFARSGTDPRGGGASNVAQPARGRARIAMTVMERHEGRAKQGGGGEAPRPVVLGTLPARPVAPSAERMAVDSAIEAGAPARDREHPAAAPVPHARWRLLAPQGSTCRTRRISNAARATAARAADLGVQTGAAARTTRHPVNALLEIVREPNAGLLVFGPDLKLVSRIRFRLAARRLRREAGCPFGSRRTGSHMVLKRERHDRPPAEGPVPRP